jgi:hypothetical protein
LIACNQGKCLRPYHVEHTSSRLIPEVKQHWAKLVLGWYGWHKYFCITKICQKS